MRKFKLNFNLSGNIQIVNKMSSTFSAKYTKCCTSERFMYNIYSHKDISFQGLQRKGEIVNFRGIFLNYYSGNVIKEIVIAFLTTVAIYVKLFILYVTCVIHKGYVISPFF